MQTMGGTIKPQSHRMCVVYDPADGRILHVHHDIALPGGSPASEAATEAAAIAQVRKRGRHAGQLRTLHAKPEDLRPHFRYKVDPAEKKLVRV